jgi:fibronectin type 3 domain-containing protein/lysophospholipase L1-like esterase
MMANPLVRRRRVIAIAVTLLLAAAGFAVSTTAAADTYTIVTPTRIMMLGDSITRGGGSSWGQGYRLSLVQRMVAGRYTSMMVGSQNSGPPWLRDRFHEGYGGYTIAGISGVVVTELNAYHPDYVLLMIGSNDVQQNIDLAMAPDRLSALVDLITNTAPGASVVVASITPLTDPVQDANARAYNAAIPGMVQAKANAGKLVSFVDMYPLITSGDLYDGVHPNDSGYAKLAAAWDAKLAALRAAPPAASTRSCPCSIWSQDDTPTTSQVSDTGAAEVGVKFRVEKDGFITAVRFYKGPDNAGPHEARLWRAFSENDSSQWQPFWTTMSAELLANGTMSNETPSGWQEVVFETPVPVQANALYFATYYAPFGRYAADAGYFRDQEIVHSPVRLPSQGSIHGNGFIHANGPGLPAPAPQSDTNYWVDVVFTPSVPAAPASVTATAVSSTQINVTWSGTANATGYRVERSTNSNTWSGVATTAADVTTYNDTGLAASSTYYYRVLATGAGGDSSPSAVVSATTQAPPVTTPPAPASLTATAFSSTRIDLAWSNVVGETGYRVERSTGGGSWVAVAIRSADVTSYSDTGLTPATAYSYRVVATNSAGGSPPSPVASATTLDNDTIPPTVPKGLKAVSAKGKVNLSWTGSTDTGGSGLAGYRVWRSTTGVTGAFTAIGTPGGASYTDSNVTGNTDYWYRVTALDAAGNQSQPSNVVSARPK